MQIRLWSAASAETGRQHCELILNGNFALALLYNCVKPYGGGVFLVGRIFFFMEMMSGIDAAKASSDKMYN